MNALPLSQLPEAEILALVERLDLRGPRYTSYPTAPAWSPAVPKDEWQVALSSCAAAGKPVALYLHLPFCHSRCWYCGCNSFITRDEDRVAAYVQALMDEIDTVVERAGAPLSHAWLHLGGGTPTHLAPTLLAGLLDHLLTRIPGAAECERSVEVDPRVTTQAHLDLLAKRGFRRISIGLQDTDPEVQKAVNREFPLDEMTRFVDLCRASGFTAVNIDLIYGLPRQSRAGWRRTLEAVSALEPDRLACFGYAHLPERIKHQRAIEESALPSPAERLGMLLDAFHHFRAQGWAAIGLDHFARPGDRLAQAVHEGRLWRNFMGYTDLRGLEMIGFGASSISEFHGLFAQNETQPEDYAALIRSQGIAVGRGHALDADDRVTAALINELMCNLRLEMPDPATLPGDEIRARFAAGAGQVAATEADGLVERTSKGWHVTELGQLFLRNLAMPFDRYLPGLQTTFSRTV